MSHRDFTYQDVAEAFVYEPEEGRLWRREPDGSLREVSLAWESNERGFVNATACFRYQKITATHICFMLQMGRWPTLGMIIDHRDGNRRNNKWSNLREGTQQQNLMNRCEYRLNEEGLERGVQRHRNRYQVKLTLGGKPTYLGCYAKDEANAVARKARLASQGEWSFEASRPADHDYAMFGG